MKATQIGLDLFNQFLKHSDPDFQFDFNIGGDDSSIPGGIEVLNQSAFRGGKLLRPRLVVAMGNCFGLDRKETRPFAVASERIHNATLFHDDVIDEAPIRRGYPTLSAGGHNRRAVIAGDLLLSRALRSLGQMGRPEIIQDLFFVLTELSEGEWLQLEARGELDIDERHLREVARKKTSSLMGWCCATPARLAERAEFTVESLRNVGLHLGTAFQMLDDVLDFDSQSGKPYAQDLVEGQINFVIADLLKRNPSMKNEIGSCLWQGIPSDRPFILNSEIQISCDEVRKKAKVEIESARGAVKSSTVSTEIQDQIETQVIQPFVKFSKISLKGDPNGNAS